MKFSLLIDTYRTALVLIKHEETPLVENYLLLGVRDPDQPIEFKSGAIYFNPLLNPAHPFIFNGENRLVSVFNGKPVKRMSKLLQVQTARGWFEIPPRSLKMSDLHADVLKLVKKAPALTGAIAQVARSTMSLKIPSELHCPSYGSWEAWFTGQQMVLTPQVKMAFTAATARNFSLNSNVRHLLLTGREPEREFAVKVRWYEYNTVVVGNRQIQVRQEWNVRIPESIMARGQEAILEFVEKKYPNWKKLIEGPEGVEEISRTEEEGKVEGPLIWFRPNNAENFTILPENQPAHVGRKPTIQDLFREAIQLSR
jgi:hypothetical protein